MTELPAPQPGTRFGQKRALPRCPRDGGVLVYQYGNWYCGGHGGGCGWTTGSAVGEGISAGRSTLEKCPQDGAMIVYNGNYFCSNWGCGWALPSWPWAGEATEEEQRLVLVLTGVQPPPGTAAPPVAPDDPFAPLKEQLDAFRAELAEVRELLTGKLTAAAVAGSLRARAAAMKEDWRIELGVRSAVAIALEHLASDIEGESDAGAGNAGR
jgi:hypothetical protein